MYKIFCLVFMLLVSMASFSQRFINKSPEKISKIVKEFYADRSIETSVQKTDSTILLLVQDPKVQSLTIQFYFDQKGKCMKERYLLSCDSCYTKFLTGVLNNKQIHWRKVDEHTYFSMLPDKLVLSLGTKDSFTYSIERSDLNRREYKEFLDNTVNN